MFVLHKITDLSTDNTSPHKANRWIRLLTLHLVLPWSRQRTVRYWNHIRHHPFTTPQNRRVRCRQFTSLHTRSCTSWNNIRTSGILEDSGLDTTTGSSSTSANMAPPARSLPKIKSTQSNGNAGPQRQEQCPVPDQNSAPMYDVAQEWSPSSSPSSIKSLKKNASHLWHATA